MWQAVFVLAAVIGAQEGSGPCDGVSFNSPPVLDYMKILALISLSSQDAPKRTNAHAGAGEIPLSHGTKGCCTGGGDNIGGS
jgi:hypothetical protein